MYKEYTMKFFLSILIISISFFKTSLAQNNVLNIDLIKIQNTDNWEFDLTYEFNNSNSNGILIILL